MRPIWVWLKNRVWIVPRVIIHAQDLQLLRYGSCPEHRILIRIKILIWWGSNINLRYWFFKGKFQSKKVSFLEHQIKWRINISKKENQDFKTGRSRFSEKSCIWLPPFFYHDAALSSLFQDMQYLFQDMLCDTFSKISRMHLFQDQQEKSLFQDTPNPPHCPTQVPPCSWSTGNGRTTCIWCTVWSSPLWRKLQSWCCGPFWRFDPQSLPLWSCFTTMAKECLPFSKDHAFSHL